MGTVPTGTGELAMMARRMLGQVAAGGQVHHRVRAVAGSSSAASPVPRRCSSVTAELPMLALILHRGGDPDAHGLQVGVPDVGRDDHAAARHLGADQFRREALPPGDVHHLFGEDALAGVVQLRPDTIASALGDPFGSHKLLLRLALWLPRLWHRAHISKHRAPAWVAAPERVRILFKTKGDVDMRPGPQAPPHARRSSSPWRSACAPPWRRRTRKCFSFSTVGSAADLDVQNRKHGRRIAESERGQRQDFRHRGVVDFRASPGPASISSSGIRSSSVSRAGRNHSGGCGTPGCARRRASGPPPGGARRIGPAELGHGFQRFQQVEGRNAAAGALRQAASPGPRERTRAGRWKRSTRRLATMPTTPRCQFGPAKTSAFCSAVTGTLEHSSRMLRTNPGLGLLPLLVEFVELGRQLRGRGPDRSVRKRSMTSLASAMRPAAFRRGAMRKATCGADGASPSAKPAHIQQRPQPGIANRAQPLQPVLDQDAVLARQRHDIGHRTDRDQLEQATPARARRRSAGQSSARSSASISLKATPAPHRFFSG